MIKIGLTGSIGMGKTTTAGIFVKHGCALWDADKTVHKLYSKGGIAVKAISEVFPTSVVNGSISRSELKVLLKEQPEKLKELEKIVHPLIQADRQNFLDQNVADIAVFDIPLLFETGLDKEMDKTVCVFTSAKNQIERLKKRNDNSITEKLNPYKVNNIKEEEKIDFNKLSKVELNKLIKTTKNENEIKDNLIQI